VAGSRSSKDPGIYNATMDILETVFYVGIIEDNMPDFINKPYEMDDRDEVQPLPASVDEAVDRLIDEMTLKDKVAMAGLNEHELLHQFGSLDLYIRNYYGLAGGNESLLNSCRKMAAKKKMESDEAVLYIIRKLWQTLKETHAIRRVK
jgi:hypothetical protein